MKNRKNKILVKYFLLSILLLPIFLGFLIYFFQPVNSALAGACNCPGASCTNEFITAVKCSNWCDNINPPNGGHTFDRTKNCDGAIFDADARSNSGYELQVKIPGLDENSIQPGGTTRPIGEYIRAIYNYATGIVGILAVVVMMFGGIVWITAFGNVSKIGEAKAWIGAALTGLVLVLTSFMIMQTVNPALVNFKISSIPSTEELKIKNYDDSLVDRQRGDASPELISLLNCIKNIPNEGQGISITSISDDNHIGQLAACNKPDCPGTCQHKCESCHYGGGLNTNKSYAIDLISKTKDTRLILPAIINNCLQYIGYSEDEESHIHLSVKECPKN